MPNLVDEGDEQVGDLPRKYLFSSIVWHIWKERKNQVLNGEEPNTAKLCYQIRSFAREVAFSFSLNSQSSLTKERRLISWSYPAAGKIKLNTDGSVKEECGRYGYGRVIRDDKGQWLGGYYGKLNQCNSLEAELHAILVGLELIRSDQRNTVIVESDSSVAVNLAKAPRDEGHPMAGLLEDIRTLLQLHGCELQHRLRQGNFCADFLANEGAGQQCPFVFLEVPPDGMAAACGCSRSCLSKATLGFFSVVFVSFFSQLALLLSHGWFVFLLNADVFLNVYYLSNSLFIRTQILGPQFQ